MGCVRETSHRKINQSWDVKEKLPPEKQSRHGMCRRNSPDLKKKKKKKKKKNEASMECVRENPQKSESSMGCVRETPHIKMKPARDV